MRSKKWLALPGLFAPVAAAAHCPLCTMGAAAAAGGAVWLGVSNAAIGVFIGAFAVSMGWWIGKLIKKQYVPFQRSGIVAISFFTTVLPLLPMMEGIQPFYISLFGSYGSLLNRTYIINLFLAGSLLGGLIVCLTPWMSNILTKWRNGKMIPFQGILLTFLLLILTGAIMQVVV